MITKEQKGTLEGAIQALSDPNSDESDVLKALGWAEDIIRRLNLKNIFQECLDKWGPGSQFIMVVQEAAELTQAITNVLLGRDGSFEHLAMEIADMEIMIGQLALILDHQYAEAYKESKPGDYYDLIQSCKELKIARLRNRLDAEPAEKDGDDIVY